MNLIKPKNLYKGDTIGILATSGPSENKENILRAKSYFENSGYKVVLSSNIFEQDGYLAGTDEEKISELHRFFKDETINAIICMRGGYGAIRLINRIDYDLIKNNPKIFCGYSDITALSAMFLKRANLMTYSGPMANSDFGAENINEFTVKSFFEAVNSDELTITPKTQKIYKKGNAKGILFGGNLSTIVSLCGQDFIPDEDFIFFTEDLNEPVYKIDKMFTQLLNIDKFKTNLKGIVLGDFLDVDNAKWLDELFTEIANNMNIPVVGGFQLTHENEKITLPYGANATLTENYLRINKF